MYEDRTLSCRDCGEGISPRYAIVEAITGLLAAALAVQGGGIMSDFDVLPVSVAKRLAMAQ